MNNVPDVLMKCPCCQATAEKIRLLCQCGAKKKYTQYECRTCGFQFTWPCPTTEEIDNFYSSGEYYQQTGSSADGDPGNYTDYDSQIEFTLDFFRNKLKTFGLPVKSTMLDVGCALGRFMGLARKEFGLECTGVELSDYARNYVTEYYGGCFPVWKSLADLPIPRKPFDLILLFDVIEHVNNPWDLLLELFQRGCAGENTRILITTPNCTLKDALKAPEHWQYRYPPAHLSFCAPETFQKIGETLLFRDIDISGHSLKEGSVGIREMLQETYSAYDGLICCFSGSILGKISPEHFPGSLEELKKSEEYLALLSEFTFERKNEPFNVQFREYLADSYDNLSAQNRHLSSELETANKSNSAMTSELATAHRNSYAMWLKLMELPTLTELDNQVKDLSIKLNEISHSNSFRIGRMITWPVRKCKAAAASVRGNLARCGQLKKEYGAGYMWRCIVRKIAGKPVCHPYDMVSSAKTNEKSHSDSFRIGRIITWPVRKCIAAAASVRAKLVRGSQLQKEYGAGYMWRCLFRKISGKPVCHPYDVVSSIGVNCEISFNLNRVHGFVDSYPLIWAFVHSLSHLSELIEDPMLLASDQKMDHNYDHNMVRLPCIDVSFHCKGLPGDILGPDGNIDEKKAQAERDELKSRLAYLAQKWKKVLTDASKTVLCILTPWEESSTTEEILAIYEALRKYPGTDLLVVLTGKEKKVSARRLRSKGILVRYITRHPPHDKVTDLQENDRVGWNRICHEFPPRDKKISRKVFKYEK